MALSVVTSLVACAPVSPQAETVHVAEAAGERSEVSFLANFAPTHALGRAQALQNAGRAAEAERLAADTLRSDAALRGLCFERFTLGGADVVLSVCASANTQQLSATRDYWLGRLGAQPGVIYVEPNAIAQPRHSITSGITS
jgi:hypothetical protein